MFADVSQILSSQLFAGKARSQPLEWCLVRDTVRIGSSLDCNIRQGWKWLRVTNTLAYYDAKLITAAKSFTVLALGASSTYLGWFWAQTEEVLHAREWLARRRSLVDWDEVASFEQVQKRLMQNNLFTTRTVYSKAVLLSQMMPSPLFLPKYPTSCLNTMGSIHKTSHERFDGRGALRWDWLSYF